MKIAREIARKAAEYNGIVGLGEYVLGLEPIIAAKLEPVREALQAGIKCALLVEHEAAEHLIRQSLVLFEGE